MTTAPSLPDPGLLPLHVLPEQARIVASAQVHADAALTALRTLVQVLAAGSTVPPASTLAGIDAESGVLYFRPPPDAAD